jgi:hypothetical protein
LCESGPWQAKQLFDKIGRTWLLKEIFSTAGAGAVAGAAGLAGAAACAGSFFSEELVAAGSEAFLQDAKGRIRRQGTIAKADFLIIGKRIAGLYVAQSCSVSFKIFS